MRPLNLPAYYPPIGRVNLFAACFIRVLLCLSYSSSLSKAGPKAHATALSEGKHASQSMIPGTPLSEARVRVSVLDFANFHPHAVRPSPATMRTAAEERFWMKTLGVCKM